MVRYSQSMGPKTDHLSQVAEIRTAQIEKLKDAGIDTKLANYTGAPPQGMAKVSEFKTAGKLQQMTNDKKLVCPMKKRLCHPFTLPAKRMKLAEPRVGIRPPFNPMMSF